MTPSPYLVKPGIPFRLTAISPSDTGQFASKEEAEKKTRTNLERLVELQELFYADARRSLLIVLQGMDTSGKDGAIRSVFSGVDPQGCNVVAFKAPTSAELAHDFLWRIHAQTPPRRMITLFNRSHYESVLVERVRSLVPRNVWSKRYAHINEFERLLADEDTVILKFFLHISREEQKQRLEKRLKDPAKMWKFDPRDLDDRKRWPQYMNAYQDALRKCSTEHAPWYVVPANKKWFRNWVISDVIVRTLQSLHLRVPPAPPSIRRVRIA